jgi:circadian clock protein KaiB
MIAQLEQALDDWDAEYRLEIMDVFEHPEDTYEDAVYATPTLVKQFPPPVARIIGDLSDRERVLMGLRLTDQDP